jgi:hypothetical protein
MIIHLIDIGFVFFLCNDEQIDESLSNEIHVILSSTDECSTFVFIVCSFLVEHLHVGILNVVKNRSVSLFVKSYSSFTFTDVFSKYFSFVSLSNLILHARK